MANVKISQLEAKTSLSANDVFPIVDTDNSATKKVTAESVKDYIRPYKVYTALLTKSGVGVVTAKVLENTLGGVVVWSRYDVGVDYAILSDAFTEDKTFVVSGALYPPGDNVPMVNIVRLNSDVVVLGTLAYEGDSVSSYDVSFTDLPFEIRVYP